MKKFTHKAHIAMPMRNKEETMRFYRDLLGFKAIDFSPSEIYIDFFDQHIAFHQMREFFPVKSPMIMLASPDENGKDTQVPSMHVGAFITASEFKHLARKLLANKEIEVAYGPITYHKDGREEYMLHFYDCNGNDLEIKANSIDQYSFDQIADWSHTNTHKY